MAKGIWVKYQASRGSLQALIAEKLTKIHRGKG